MFIKTKASLVPKRSRAESESPFASTVEWRKMKAAIDAGLKPESAPHRGDAEAAMIELTIAEKEAIGLSSRRTYFKFVQAYLKENNLQYPVKSFRHGDKDYIVVTGPKAMRPTAKKKTRS